MNAIFVVYSHVFTNISYFSMIQPRALSGFCFLIDAIMSSNINALLLASIESASLQYAVAKRYATKKRPRSTPKTNPKAWSILSDGSCL